MPESTLSNGEVSAAQQPVAHAGNGNATTKASGGGTHATAAVDASPEDSRAVAHGQGGNASVPESTLSDGEVSAAQQLGAGTVGEARCTGHA